MKSFKILLIEDDPDWTKNFVDNIKAIPVFDLAGKNYDHLSISVVTNQVDADLKLAETDPNEFDLILLDLLYPKEPNTDINEKDGFLGLEFLPELRRLQPDAAIVILTSYPHVDHLGNAVRAIRDHHANDFVPKTAPFPQIVGRIGLACENAHHIQNVLKLEEEFRLLLRSHSTRTYSEAIASLLNENKSAFNQIAKKIESRDISAFKAAPNEIRKTFEFIKNEFLKITETLCDFEKVPYEIDVAEVLRQMIVLYDWRLEKAMTKAEGPSEGKSVKIITFGSDLRFALHEIIRNSIESLERSQKPVSDRKIILTVDEKRIKDKSKSSVTITILDTGDGFSNDAFEHRFEPRIKSRQNGHNKGIGLFIAKRMINSIGGEINICNRKEGGAEVEITIGNFR